MSKSFSYKFSFYIVFLLLLTFLTGILTWFILFFSIVLTLSQSFGQVFNYFLVFLISILVICVYIYNFLYMLKPENLCLNETEIKMQYFNWKLQKETVIINYFDLDFVKESLSRKNRYKFYLLLKNGKNVNLPYKILTNLEVVNQIREFLKEQESLTEKLDLDDFAFARYKFLTYFSISVTFLVTILFLIGILFRVYLDLS